MTPSSKGKGDWYKKNCEVTETVWRSSRINDDGDELVVAKGTQEGKTGYFMAWEVKENRSECISWNGKVSWYPRMFWEYIRPKNKILVEGELELLEQRVPATKRSWHSAETIIEHEGQFYLKLIPFSKNKEKEIVHKPQVDHKDLDAMSRAIEYVQWFNENHRQLKNYDKLLSTTKKARKRRKLRLRKRLTTERIAVDIERYFRA